MQLLVFVPDRSYMAAVVVSRRPKSGNSSSGSGLCSTASRHFLNQQLCMQHAAFEHRTAGSNSTASLQQLHRAPSTAVYLAAASPLAEPSWCLAWSRRATCCMVLTAAGSLAHEHATPLLTAAPVFVSFSPRDAYQRGLLCPLVRVQCDASLSPDSGDIVQHRYATVRH